MKIHHKTKRGLNRLKFGACSEILTFLGENENRGHNYSVLLLKPSHTQQQLVVSCCRVAVLNKVFTTLSTNQRICRIFPGIIP